MKILLAMLLLQGIAAAQAGSEPRGFDAEVLTPDGQEAYRALLSMKEAHGTGVGIAGFSNPEAPLYYLWDDPGGAQALRALLVEASPAGRFLAHCGLLSLDLEGDRACLETLADEEDLVTVYPGGCTGYQLPLGEAVERFATDMSTSLRRHWGRTRLARQFAPRPGYERNLSPTGRQAMEILRAASYVDGAYWVAVEDAIGPLGALYQLLNEGAAADALVDLVHHAGPAGRIYGAGGLALACGAATPKALQFLESDTKTVRLEIEGRFRSLSVADATKLLFSGSRNWTRGIHARREEHKRAREREEYLRARGKGDHERAPGKQGGPSPFARDRLTPAQQEAYDSLARAEVVQLGRWQDHAPSTRALLTLWDAEDAAGAFALLSATASPAGRLLALCGLQVLDPHRARRVELALRKSGLAVQTLAADGIDHAGMEFAVAALVSDGQLPRRLRSEWNSARGGGAQEDPRRELSWVGFRLPPTIRARDHLENPFRLERCGFGEGLARAGSQLLVGASVFIDPKQRGAVFVLRSSGDDWAPAQTILPSTQALRFGNLIAASDSILVIVRGGGTYGRNEPVESAVEIYERADHGWTRSAAFGAERGRIADLAVTGETAVVVERNGAFVLQRGPVRWERRDLTMPEGASFRSTGLAVADGRRIALGHAGGVSVFERTGDGWTHAAELTHGEDRPLGTVSSLALEGDRLLVGDRDGFGSGNEGSVVAFAARSGRWVPTQTLRGSDSHPGDRFGDCLALDGDRLVVLGRRGPARLFELEGGLWRERAKLVAGVGSTHHPLGYDALGTGVCDLSGDLLLIGMPHWREGDGRVAVFDVAAALERARR